MQQIRNDDKIKRPASLHERVPSPLRRDLIEAIKDGHELTIGERYPEFG